MHPTLVGIMHNYKKKISERRISNVCKMAGIKTYGLPSVKGSYSENVQLCMCNMLTLKQFRNKLCKMAHLLPMDTEKAYTEKLVNILSTGVASTVKNPKDGKCVDYHKQPRVSFPASGV